MEDEGNPATGTAGQPAWHFDLNGVRAAAWLLLSVPLGLFVSGVLTREGWLLGYAFLAAIPLGHVLDLTRSKKLGAVQRLGHQWAPSDDAKAAVWRIREHCHLVAVAWWAVASIVLVNFVALGKP